MEFTNKVKKRLTIENILCLFIVISPILDMISFLFRNTFETKYSPTTIIRPLIAGGIAIAIFVKKGKQEKKTILLVALGYLFYGIFHLFLFQQTQTKSSAGDLIHEAQYIINYSFLVLNLYLYQTVFQEKKKEKLKRSILYMVAIYLIGIFIAILTNTSSYTYPEEQIGYKGWIESGDSISSILILSIFIITGLVTHKKQRKIAIPILILTGIFLTIFVGTRVGLYGFFLVIFVCFGIEMIDQMQKQKKIHFLGMKRTLVGIGLLAILIVTIGSSTMQRRQCLKDKEEAIHDESIKQEAHVTGDILALKEKIENNTLEKDYMNETQRKSILELYEIANQYEIKSNDQRMQQLIYQTQLIKNQENPWLILFGNGYTTNYRELVFEMEVPAILFNFGIVGFLLYLGPFLVILIKGIVQIGKRRKQPIEKEEIRMILGAGMAFALSFFSGYTFFNTSTMLVIVVLHVMIGKQEIKKKEDQRKEKKEEVYQN